MFGGESSSNVESWAVVELITKVHSHLLLRVGVGCTQLYYVLEDVRGRYVGREGFGKVQKLGVEVERMRGRGGSRGRVAEVIRGIVALTLSVAVNAVRERVLAFSEVSSDVLGSHHVVVVVVESNMMCSGEEGGDCGEGRGSG